MNNRQFIILALFFVFTNIIRTIYEILKHKKLITPNKLSFIVIFINMALMWVSWFLLCIIDTSSVYLPAVIRYSGFLLIVLGIITFLIALFTIKTLETYSGGLITTGIYSKIRHPMYLGFILWAIGVPVFYGAVYSFIIALPFIANILFWRHLEEIELVNRFPAYRDYRLKTIF